MNELIHYGVLGMKWGIRRYQPYPKGSGKTGKEVGLATKVKQRVKKMKYNSAVRTQRRGENKLRKYDKWTKSAGKTFETALYKSRKWGNSVAPLPRVYKRYRENFWAQQMLSIGLAMQMKAYKGSKYYQKTLKKIGKYGLSYSPEVREIGERYIQATSKDAEKTFDKYGR